MKKIILIAGFLLVASFSIAQQLKNEHTEEKYRVINWGLTQGLSQAENYYIIKDKYGFMWIGSKKGLNRFDGNNFKVYFHDPQKPATIPSDDITGFVEDSLNNIWIGTSYGMARYDIRADTFANFLPGKQTSRLNIRTYIPFWATKDEVFCIEKEYEVTAYNIHSFAKRTLAKLDLYEGRLTGIAGNYSVYDSIGNSLWLMVFELGKENSGLLHISLVTGEKQFFTWPFDRNKGHYGHVHDAEAMRYDPKRNSIWVNSTDGLLEFTLKDNKFHQVNISQVLDPRNKFDEDLGRYVGIDLDAMGNVWFATVTRGIIIYDPVRQSATLPIRGDSLQQMKISDANAFIYCDRDSIVWLGSYLRNGIYQLNPFSSVAKRYRADKTNANSLSDDFVIMCGDAGHGKLWIGTANGLNIFDPQQETFQTLYAKDLPGIPDKTIFPLLIDTVNRKAWLESAGIHEMNMMTRQCKPIIFKDANNKIIPGLRSGFPRQFRKGLIITSVFNEQAGIFFLNPDSAIARQVLSFPTASLNPFAVFTNETDKIFLHRDDSLGYQTYINMGAKWKLMPCKLDSISWIRLMYNKNDQSYWAVAFQQLLHYDSDFKLIKKYSTADGIPEFEIYSTVPDNQGNIWFNTDRSIYKLNYETGKVIMLTEKDGYQPQDFIAVLSAYRSASGDIYFPGGPFGKGFDRIRPAKFISPPSHIYLQSLQINQSPFPLSTGINNLQELSLRYFENKITIETGIVDYYSKGQSYIRYKLEGGEIKKAGWQYAPGYYTIRYEELPPGKYTLSIQAGNASNDFNGPVKTLLINISPAFWNTWWFRILALLFAAVLLYGLIRYRSRNLKERNLLLEKKVTQRTNELNNSLAELKTTQDQLIQSEKMASLGELTSGIAHEIKNPLNFVNNFSEINMELITEIEEEQIQNSDEGNRVRMAPIINTLKKNLEKINHHGKRIDGIVKGMLQHSRLGNVTKEAVDINALCDESLKLAWHSFKAKEKTFNASFETRFDPDLPNVMVFPQDFGRVMINLFNNAFYAVHEKKKHNQSGSPDALQTESLYKPLVIVSTKKEGNKIFITVSDNGMGIPSAILNKIFQPFFTTKPTGEGTGLGLSMSYDIISKSHGGEIKAKSKEGLGTDFEIMLPVSLN